MTDARYRLSCLLAQSQDDPSIASLVLQRGARSALRRYALPPQEHSASSYQEPTDDVIGSATVVVDGQPQHVPILKGDA